MKSIVKAYYLSTFLGFLAIPFFPIFWLLALIATCLLLFCRLIIRVFDWYDYSWFGMLNVRHNIKKMMEVNNV